MTLRKADGTIIKLANITDVTDPVTQPNKLVFTEPVYETYNQEGATKHEKNRRLRFRTGEEILEADLQAEYTTATVTGISPATGAAAGGTTVTLTGTNLQGTTGVTIGGVATDQFKIISDTKISCRTGAHAAGAVNVVVADDAGNVTKSNYYTYV